MDVTALRDFFHYICTGHDSGQRVITIRVGLGAGNYMVRTVEEVDHPAREARIAGGKCPAAGDVIEHLAADRRDLDFAEVHSRDVRAAGRRDGNRRSGRNPARFRNDLEGVAPRPDVAERECAARSGRSLRDLSALDELDGPAGESGIARDERAAIGRIVEYLAADRDRLELAEIEVVNGLPAGCRHREGPRIRDRGHIARLFGDDDRVRAGENVGERVFAVRVGRGGGDLGGPAYEVDGPAG